MHKLRSVISILVIAVVLLGVVPMTAAGPPDGEVPPPGQVMIVRDEYGAPHVFGSTPESLWYGFGYAQAQDRLWQADLLRRTVQGTTAEFFGPSAVAGDALARAMWGPHTCGRCRAIRQLPCPTRP